MSKRKRRQVCKTCEDQKNFDVWVEVLILAGCAVCARRLGQDNGVCGQILEDADSPFGIRVTCDPCIANLLGQGKL